MATRRSQRPRVRGNERELMVTSRAHDHEAELMATSGADSYEVEAEATNHMLEAKVEDARDPAAPLRPVVHFSLETQAHR
ncbi:hypothetical protein NL676_022445 [Syzygium grande]|nr:hypothetical protein NL676_022445 [Syzygium grande]